MENTNSKIYANFQEIWADYPQARTAALRIDKGERKQTLYLHDDPEKVTSYVFILGVWDTWHCPLIDQTQDWLELLATQDKLESLAIGIDSITNEKHTYNLPAVPRLRTLIIEMSAAYFETAAHLHISESADLASLVIHGQTSSRGVVSQLGKMHALKSFAAKGVQIPDFPALLAQLNPQNLESLSLCEMRKFSFFPAKGRKKDTTPQHLAVMETFTRLKSLSFINCRIDQLPFSLACFRELENLMLTASKLDNFPPDILQLPPLKKLNIDKTPLTRKRIIRGSSDLENLIKHLAEVQASEEDRKKLFPLLVCDEAALQDVPVGELLRLAALSKNAGIKQNVLIACEKKTVNPFLPDAQIQHIALVGKLPHMSLEEINEHLATKQIQVSKKISAKTQMLCIADVPTEKEWAIIVENTLPVCFTSHLRALVQQAQDLYLAKLEPTNEDSLLNMLGSNDEASIRVALKMLASGGLPALLLEYFFLWYMNTHAPLRQEVRTLLERYATRAQMIALGRVMQMHMYPRTHDLVNTGEFDSERISDAIKKYHWLKWHTR